MTPELWNRLKPLYHTAMELPPPERSQFIVQVCGGDCELKEELASLVSASDTETDFGDEPLVNLRDLLATKHHPLPVGELILGRFKIVRHLGSGGMGDVYEAIDLELGPIALKTIRSDIVCDVDVLARFKKEVQLARKVSGPHICRIHELFIPDAEAKGFHSAFLTMELLDGVTLADKIRLSGPIALPDAQTIALEICAGLQTIHEAGIIHRDLKSRNIMLASRNGSTHAVLMDFGVARELSPARPGDDSTMPGTVVGTPAYMSPEQLRGTPVSQASDIYSLGVVLHELVTGRRPRAKNDATLSSVSPSASLSTPSSGSRLPRHWVASISRCMEYEPADRFQSASEVSAALQFPSRQISLASPRTLKLLGLSTALAALAISIVIYARRQNLEPPECGRRYEQGLTALREGSYLGASRFLQQAVDACPENTAKHTLASAGLAAAFNELNFSKKATEQILALPDSPASLSDQDQLYVKAIRATIAQHFDTAANAYTALLKKLPSSKRAFTLLTRGLVNEKRGEIKRAKDDYSAAAVAYHDAASTSSAHEYAAAFLHRGILETHQQKTSDAEIDFTTAENAYRDAGNFEGLAEVNFQRGYAAELRSNWKEAAAYLNKSIDAAHEDIASSDLESRARSHLITVATNSADPDALPKALAEAEKTVSLARSQGGYWAVDSSIREADIYLAKAYTDGDVNLSKQDYARAEDLLKEALGTAVSNGWPRLEALANLTLASSHDQQNKPPADVLHYAYPARDYYQKAGFLSESVSAGVIIGRNQVASTDYRAALDTANQAMNDAYAVGNPRLIDQAEELLGTVDLSLENYPEALTHMQAALDRSKAIRSPLENQMIYIADILWRLGRYQESQHVLAALPPAAMKQLDTSLEANRILAEMRLSQGKYQEVLQRLHKETTADPDDVKKKSSSVKMAAGQAAASLNMKRQATNLCQQALAEAQESGDVGATAQAQRALATVYLSRNDAIDAKPLAEAALQSFQKANQRDSGWRTLALLGRICRQTTTCAPDSKYEQKAMDKLAEMKQTWQPTVYGAYASRPDIRLSLASLRK